MTFKKKILRSCWLLFVLSSFVNIRIFVVAQYQNGTRPRFNWRNLEGILFRRQNFDLNTAENRNQSLFNIFEWTTNRFIVNIIENIGDPINRTQNLPVKFTMESWPTNWILPFVDVHITNVTVHGISGMKLIASKIDFFKFIADFILTVPRFLITTNFDVKWKIFGLLELASDIGMDFELREVEFKPGFLGVSSAKVSTSPKIPTLWIILVTLVMATLATSVLLNLCTIFIICRKLRFKSTLNNATSHSQTKLN